MIQILNSKYVKLHLPNVFAKGFLRGDIFRLYLFIFNYFIMSCGFYIYLVS